ncbi:MAG: class I SAM-dependent methyltransferase [Steroidobacteraceae bacterium]|jgi:precorrin-6B methylase 2|nr:class I SAM-dependent methyltransferase [Steroidobacteraceae bacterium]
MPALSRKTVQAGALAGALLASAVVGLVVARNAVVTKDVIYVPTPQEVVDKMLEIADVGPNDRVMDLGSGDGRIVVSAAKRGARAVGIEIDPELVAQSRANVEGAKVQSRAEIRDANIFETDLSQATVITMYLLPSLNMKLRPKLLELKPGTRIVTHAFDMQDWKPDRQQAAVGREIYLWIVPARVAGVWNLERDGQQLRLTLRQQFQDVGGTAMVGDQQVPVEAASLRGDELRFSLTIGGRPQAFRAKVEGDRLVLDPPWRATRAATARLR